MALQTDGMVSELGFLDQSYDEIPMGTSYDFGTGFSVPMDSECGKLEFLLNFTAGDDNVIRARLGD